ncbi:hypothetical protein ZIOFF_010767 [Zingiber officinale]|uniref:Integrase catalytic domain-containing protein n=1 Tax=Zingiber officinale TaxID=94328 RepID=A0A8J5LSA7_ZINOF|nr:hypothetical protein ZIOFF_010767 [Zingiber officinale]
MLEQCWESTGFARSHPLGFLPDAHKLSTYRQRHLFTRIGCYSNSRSGLSHNSYPSKRVDVDNGKIEAVLHSPQPTTLRALRGFLRLTGYYRKFVQGYGVLASPLTSLLRRNSFEWNELAELAFQKLKIALTSTLVLALPDFSKSFVVDCDASDMGIGAILQQEGRPIAFFSRLAQRHKKLPAYEKELIGLAKSIRHWRAYLWGHKFLVRTDHYSLKFLLKQRITNSPQQHWISMLGFDFIIEYQAGRNNVAADALLRRDNNNGVSRGEGRMEYKEGLLFFKGRIYLLATSRSHVVREYPICQHNKVEHLKPAGLLQPLLVPHQVWSDISMDFIDGLPLSQGKTILFVVVDRFSKYAHFIPLSHPYTVVKVARVFFDNIFKLHGLPETIISNHDATFTSSLWKELFRLRGTQLCFSSAYHPQSDDQTEVVNKVIEMYLRCFTGEFPKKWELQTREQLLKNLRGNLLAAQNRMKLQYDSSHREHPRTIQNCLLAFIDLLKSLTVWSCRLQTPIVKPRQAPPSFSCVLFKEISWQHP